MEKIIFISLVILAMASVVMSQCKVPETKPDFDVTRVIEKLLIFLILLHTNFVKKFGGIPKCNKRAKMMKNDIFCMLYQILYRVFHRFRQAKSV
jgi:hypothetical protein